MMFESQSLLHSLIIKKVVDVVFHRPVQLLGVFHQIIPHKLRLDYPVNI